MRCPFCQADQDRVVDSRSGENGAVVRRRRECLACKRRFTTYERVEESPLKVIKKDGRREAYDRAKLRDGVDKACGRLPISEEQKDKLVSEVESDVIEKFDREVPTSVIGEKVMEKLRKLHQVAYVRFASVYREFRDVSEFGSLLQEFLKERAGSVRRPKEEGAEAQPAEKGSPKAEE